MKDERVNEYATRLRALAAHCNFAATLNTEILRLFVVSCGMIQGVVVVNRVVVVVVVWVDAIDVGGTRSKVARSATRSTNNAKSVARPATMRSCVVRK